MTAVLDSTTRREGLIRRLESLRHQRDQLRIEIAPTMFGDDADRATNVDGHVQLALLNDRILAVELALADVTRRPGKGATDVIEIGDVVTVDLGDGPENYLLATVEEAGTADNVITPGSPLGRALLGAAIGSTVEYRAAHRAQRAKVLAAA